MDTRCSEHAATVATFADVALEASAHDAVCEEEHAPVMVWNGLTVSRVILSPVGLESVHLRSKVADVSSGSLVVIAAFSPLMGQLTLSVVGRSTDPTGRLAKGVARRDGRKLLIGV